MRSIRLRNIRSLKDTGYIDLKPITLFLGQNSSGKSTVLRSLPLLMQSVQTRSNAPILWYGDLVDFGSAEEVISSFAGDDPIVFDIDLGPVSISPRRRYKNLDRHEHVKYSISLDAIDGKTSVRAFDITVDRDVLTVAFDQKEKVKKISFNGTDYADIMDIEAFTFFTSNLVPQFYEAQTMGRKNDSMFLTPRRHQISAIERQIFRFFEKRLPKRIKGQTIETIARRISYAPKIEFKKLIIKALSTLKSGVVLGDILSTPEGEKDYNLLRSLYFLMELPEIIGQLDRQVNRSFGNVSYVGPSRATGERYYRMQELAINKIDPQGQNLAMFLNSLPTVKQRQFSEWLEASIGYAVKIERSVGHIQIRLREQSSDLFFNIADMGYGFSQVLPILAQVWSQGQSLGPIRWQHPTSFVAMEQPELHLHPAYQAALADVFSKAINSLRSENRRGGDLRFVIETHSEALVNRMGELIYNGELNHDDVAIYVFEKDFSDDASTVKSVTFNEKGELRNWPIGFFSAVK